MSAAASTQATQARAPRVRVILDATPRRRGDYPVQRVRACASTVDGRERFTVDAFGAVGDLMGTLDAASEQHAIELARLLMQQPAGVIGWTVREWTGATPAVAVGR